jgi:hypothetical protein
MTMYAKYRFLLWQLIAALDSGTYDRLDIEEVRRHANAGTMPAFFIDRFPDFDFSMFEPKDWTDVADTWASMANAIDAKRKFGVENKGMALLLGYTLQCLQNIDFEERKAASR